MYLYTYIYIHTYIYVNDALYVVRGRFSCLAQISPKVNSILILHSKSSRELTFENFYLLHPRKEAAYAQMG